MARRAESRLILLLTLLLLLLFFSLDVHAQGPGPGYHAVAGGTQDCPWSGGTVSSLTPAG